MKIQAIQKALDVRKVQSSQQDAPSNPEHKADVVQISGASKELTALAMSNAPEEVDLAALKAAIQSGEYQPDLDRLADRILTDGDAISNLLKD